MAGWIDIEDSLPTHRKTLEVADDLGIEPVQLVGHLTCLWLWATNNADNDGRLPDGIRPKTLARAAFWPGDADAFVSALSGRFLDVADGGQLRIHDWGEHFGKFAEKREQDSERKRAWRGRQNGTSTGRDADATRDGARTVPNQTVPNQSTDTECPLDSSARGASAPDVAPPRRAVDKTIGPKWQEVAPGVHRGSPGGQGEVSLLKARCSLCEVFFPVDEIEGHDCVPKIGEAIGRNAKPGNLGEHMPRRRLKAAESAEVEAELAAMARRKAGTPPELPTDLVAEHELRLARERSVRQVANAPPVESAAEHAEIAAPANPELAVQPRGSP